jgi:hypothetical protein
VVLTDHLPSGLQWVSTDPAHGHCAGRSKISCALGTLHSHGSVTIHVTVRATRSGTFTNPARATGKVHDPNLHNNHASAGVTASPPPCAEDLVFRTGFMPVDLVGLVKVYVDGRLRQTLHGHNLRQVSIKPVPATGTHSVTVLFILDGAARETVAVTRTYRNCASGPTTYSYPPQTNPGAS